VAEEQVEREATPEEIASRRRFLGLTALIGAAFGGLAGFPAGRFFAAPLFPDLSRPKRWVDIGPLSEFGEERQEREYTFEAQDGWYNAERTRRIVVGKENGDWVAFSTECPHAGCGVSWDGDKQQFLCSCHAGVFAADGSVVSGPPPRPLDRLVVREADGRLEVQES
jgi:Rieske Fe-S protein